MVRPLDADKQARWLDLVQRWQRSLVTVREFCERNCVSEASFFAWRRVLRQRGVIVEPTAVLPPKAGRAASAFIEVAMPGNSPSDRAVEIVLKQRRRLRVRPGFDADTVRQLVRLLEDV